MTYPKVTETHRQGQKWPVERVVYPSHTVKHWDDPLERASVSLREIGRITGRKVA